jgi:hypothetical protein
MKISAATIILFFWLGSASQAACFINRFSFTLGIDSSTSGTTDGSPCAIRLLGSRNPIYGTNITSRPRGGTASVNGRTTVMYHPNAGFKGQDSFAFQWVGKEGGITPMASTVNVSVTVN